jgi:drug/metabolite transporter (DMT)-like permease
MDIGSGLRQCRTVKQTKVLLAGLAVVILWASAFPAIRVASPALGVFGLSFVRIGIAAIALLALAPLLHVRLPARRDLPLVLLCAFLGMPAYQLLLNWGELAVPAGTSSIIVAAAPLVSVAVATLALGERLTSLKVLGSVVAMGGVATVCLAHSGVALSTSVWIVVAAMVVQGLYHPLTRPLLRRYSGVEVATYGMVLGSVMLLPTVPIDWASLISATPPAWFAAIYLGLVPSALGFVLWGYAVGRLPVATSTSLLYLVPPVAVVIAFVWLGELPYWSELVGGLVVIVGVLTVSRGDALRLRLGGRGAASCPAIPDLEPEVDQP